jgi:hypothetical protein
MNECPHCHRRLLSHTSPNCSWCGQEIKDTAYQQNAAVERQAYFAEQAMHDAISLARIESIAVGDPYLTPLDPFLDPFTGMPLGYGPRFPRRMPRLGPMVPPVGPMVVPLVSAPPQNGPAGPAPAFGHAYDVPETPAEEPVEEPAPGDRFRHLEL